jgi:RIP metalloprotease RseP
VTDIIDPAVAPAGPYSPAPAPPPPPVEASEPPPSSRLLPIVGVLAFIAFIVRFTGWWGLLIVVGLIVSITLHELGHFLTAKQAGMKVTEFFLGFGPPLFSFTRGETTYGVKPLPLGAYVRIIGMNDLEDVEPGDTGRTYREKGYWARLRVVLAGPFTNLAIALILLLLAFGMFTQPNTTGWKVDSVVPASAAAAAGMKKGDRPISIDGQPVGSFTSAFTDIVQRHAGHPVTLVVQRGNQRVTLRPTVGWQLDAAGAASLAPIEEGDKVVSVGGAAVADYAETRAALAHAPKGSTRVEFERDGYTYATTVPTPMSLPAKGANGFLGISARARFERLGPVQVVTTSVTTFGSIVKGSVASLGHFFSPSNLTSYTHYVLTNKVPAGSPGANPNPAPIVKVSKGAPSPTASPQALASSPANNRIMSIIGVVRLGSQEGALGGLFAVITLLALINIFLALINLLPLLPFDGGHAAIATYEAIREKLSGRPYRADAAKLLPLTYAFIVLLAFLMLSSGYLDIVHPVHLPGQ